MSATKHSLIARCYYMPPSSIRCASMMTKYPPLSSYVTSNRHVWTVAYARQYHLQHARRVPANQLLIYSSTYCSTSARLCRSHLYHGGLLVVPDLRLVRNILRRHRKETQFDLRRLHYHSC